MILNWWLDREQCEEGPGRPPVTPIIEDSSPSSGESLPILDKSISMNFAIVEFFATNNARATIAIVPVGWLSREEDEVWWPPVNSSKASAMAKCNVLVRRNWKKMMVRILGKARKLFHFCT